MPDIFVKDRVCLNAGTCEIEVARSITINRNPQSSESKDLSFSVPVEAQLGNCSHNFSTVRKGNQRLVHVQLNPQPSGESEEVNFPFSLSAKRSGNEWRLSGRSLLVCVTGYELELVMSRPVNHSSWDPGDFLRDAVLDPRSGTAALSKPRVGSSPLIVDFSVAFRFQEPTYTCEEIDELLSKMRVLNSQALRKDDAFKNYRVIVILHFLLDLLPFMRALELRGLDPHKTLALYKDYPYSNRDLVRSTLESRGVTVWGPVGSTNGLELAAGVRDFLAEGDEPVIIVEDGGYLAPAFYNTEELRPYLHRIRGVVEQTTFGARQAEDLLVEMQRKGEEARLAFPLINVARSEAKVLYEPAFVAEAACNNIVIKLGGLSWINTGVLLIGYGAIGRAMFSMLKRLQARVVVCDPSPLRLLLADSEQANFIAPSIPSAIAWFKEQKINLDFVIGTTGKQSVLVADAIAMAGWSPRLVSVSSKRIEFAIEDFGTQAQSDRPLMIQEHNIGTEYIFSSGSIKVLGDGYPINFVSSESVPNERIDPIMALLHVCAAELANPDVLLVGGAFLGEADSVYPGIPRTRISHEIVQTIIDKTDLFRPLLSNSHSEVKQI